MKKNKTSNKSVQDVTPTLEGGHFGSGFFLGLLGGAVGMFLLGTKQGHQVLRTVKEQLNDKADEVMEPETKQKLIAAAETATQTAKQAATQWQEKFPKFQRKDLSS